MSETPHTRNDPSPENMQLTIDALNAHPGIVVVGGFERSFLDPRRCPPNIRTFAHTLDIFTHPATPTYDPEALEELATALIGDIPTSYRAHSGWTNYTPAFAPSLKLPRWQVDDKVGWITMQGAIRLDATATVVKTGQLLPEIPLAYDIDLRQRTSVVIFPDVHHMADAITDHLGDYTPPIPKDKLGKSENTDVSMLKHAPALGYPYSPEVEDKLKAQDALGSLPTRILESGGQT